MGTAYKQAHLPFGTPLDAESTITTNNRRFTSYDRSSRTGLDYAVNRHYDSKQGRFTRVDPIGMAASNLANPQSLNMYAYVENDPINYTDPSGLFMLVERPMEMSWLELCWRLGICGNPRPSPSGGGEEFPAGGGGQEATTRRRDDIDPCAGKKGKLDYSSALQHITERHIEQIPKYKNKKSYYTFGSLTSMTEAKQTEVINLNQEAFEKGGAITLSGGGIAYIYAPYNKYGVGPFTAETGFIGADEREGFKYTNVRTVIVKPDCETVETSYPGLPRGINSNDPRIVGNPQWRKAFNSKL